MQPKAIIALLTVNLVASGASAKFVDEAIYAKHLAPALLQHIASYRTEGNTGPQASFLDQAEDVVNKLDVSKLESLKDACAAAFGQEECAAILHPRGPVKRGTLGKRDSCQCSTQDSWCDNNTRCAQNAGGCRYVSGCGTLYRYECDGECVN